MRQFAGTGDLVIYQRNMKAKRYLPRCLCVWVIGVGKCWTSVAIKRDVKATFLLQYRSMQWAQSRGCSYFDFRTIPQVLEPGEEMWGVYEFKKGFGGSHV